MTEPIRPEREAEIREYVDREVARYVAAYGDPNRSIGLATLMARDLLAEMDRLRAVETAAAAYVVAYRGTVENGPTMARVNENVRLVKTLALSVGVILYPAKDSMS